MEEDDCQLEVCVEVTGNSDECSVGLTVSVNALSIPINASK